MTREIFKRIGALAAMAAAVALAGGQAAQAVLSTDDFRTRRLLGLLQRPGDRGAEQLLAGDRGRARLRHRAAASPNLDDCDGGLSNGTGGDLMDYVII